MVLSVPSGALTGINAALKFRDKDPSAYLGKRVDNTVTKFIEKVVPGLRRCGKGGKRALWNPVGFKKVLCVDAMFGVAKMLPRR